MKSLSRRDLCVALSALAAVGTGAVPEAEGQAKSNDVLDKPRAWTFESLPVKKNANGGESRSVVQGVVATGEPVEVHETMLPPGQMPHPPHRHRHSEFIFVREGQVEAQSGDMKTRLGPGGVIFYASNIMHGLKNVGTTNANYFVIAIGRAE